MRKTRKLKPVNEDAEDDYLPFEHKRVAEFHPHCFVQPLALAEAKQFDELYALAHHPVHGDEEEA